MTAFENAYLEVQKLVQKFENNYFHYMSATYSESEARQDFIDDLFIALGWDVTHRSQTNPYEQEVKIERSQKQQNESARKRADYAFFLAPNHKDEVFFVEAKKPSVLIQNQPQHYFQTIRYGWNAGCPISVLTDFEEFVIIDCRSKPDIKYALNGQHKSFRYTDYINIEKFKEIYWVFSREAVSAGSIKKYAELLPKAKGKVVQKALFKGGYQAIDDSFLEYIDAIRLNLAQAFKRNDESLDGEQLTEAVQRTVDRLVFIRFLEDKFIEADSHVNEWAGWKDFVTDCRKLDAKYNGVVFKKHFIDEQDFTGAEDALFKEICQDISSYNSPFDFNYIPIHILGSIYERFLGKVIRTTAKRVFVEEKPEVRKAGGVYYTPKYIVDYIVQNTVGKQIEGKTPKQIADLHFADIACGSGSFLIGVYDCLLDYHKKYYVEKLIGKTELDKRNEDYENVEYKNNQWLLTLKLKQDIILNNIYGVDIDYQAVEVTQLSLFLKMLEDESLSSIGIRQGRMFAKVLPDLTKNIVCGNSLIGYDIMQLNGGLFEDAELKKLNPLDYNAAFPKVMRSGGFDGIVGNPPYGLISNNYLRDKTISQFKIVYNNIDNYILFILKSCEIINNNKTVSLIIPSTWLYMPQFIGFRTYVINKYKLLKILLFKQPVFKEATVETCIIFLEKSNPDFNYLYAYEEVKDSPLNFNITTEIINSLDLKKLNSFIISNSNDSNLFDDLKNKGKILKEIALIVCGLTPYRLGKGKPKQTKQIVEKRSFDSENKINSSYRQYIMGRDFKRYSWQIEKMRWISYGDWLAEPRYKAPFNSSKKIVIRQTADSIIGNIDENQYLSLKNVHNVVLKDDNFSIETLLGILNSKLITWWYRKMIPETGRVFAEVKIINLEKIPIIKKTSANEVNFDKIHLSVAKLLSSKQKLALAKEGRDKDFINNQCNALDAQIDNLVYELYDLTEEEIKIVEGA